MDKKENIVEEKIFSVTEKDVNEAIMTESYWKIGNKTTICLFILNNGFEIVGSSAPVDPKKFDFTIGKKLARERAVDQVWAHLGSIVQWQKAMYDHEMLLREAELAEEKENSSK